jgi:quercetin dioxygenase-like cupin family protein
VQIVRNSLATEKCNPEWFTGDAFYDTIADVPAPARANALSVHFTPGARTAWHTHPLGQTIYVTDGVGLCQREGGLVEEIRPGDRVWFEPDEKHWHGAAPDRFMTHIGIGETDPDSGEAVAWDRHVSDAEYTGPRVPSD